MTEAEWLNGVSGGDLDRMLTHLRKRGTSLVHRKMRLFAHACWRRAWDRMGDIGRRVEEISERYADGLASFSELRAAWKSDGAFSEPPDDEAFVEGIMFDLEPAVELVAGHYGDDYDEERGDAEWRMQCFLLRDVFGNPFRPVIIDPQHLTAPVTSLAQAIYIDRAFDRLPILADALEDAGCTDPDILAHCRGPGPHVRGCWVVDLLLGKS